MIVKDRKGNILNVGDIIRITNSGCGTSPRDIGIEARIVRIGNISATHTSYHLEIDKDKEGNRDRFLGEDCVELVKKVKKVNIKFKLPNVTLSESSDN